MNKRQWSKRTGAASAAQRAGGRRRHNAERKRRMWERRFAILRICSMTGDLPHGGQQRLAERFGAHKSVISRDVAWAQGVGSLGSGFTLRCSYRRGTVTIEWTNTRVEKILRTAQRWLNAAEREDAT